MLTIRIAPDDESMLRSPRLRQCTAVEVNFLALWDGAHRWLVEAAAGGVPRIRRKTARAVEFAAVLGPQRVDRALTEHVASGMTNKDIAAKLVLAPGTVEGHVEHILEKLGMSRRHEIAAAIEHAERGTPR
ncbi:response regulator transcription factor [Rhodococcus sp. 14C212]|uniref:LuxR C-terminal-related transcriptional regulator n=1 Tax=Rhodococcus sp. 14C212 TaxID=2711209 RepID=UPI0013ED9DFD|nr:LuxR C-terminal-related transcriptional regulator [Rhodococcus sp. 14C212]NGP08109.1 response regulator transcription factor [Rhodococcus sp. 14C212]